MQTNDSKLLEKVLSKHDLEVEDLEDTYIAFEDEDLESDEVSVKTLLSEMESEARTEGYNEGQRDTARQIFKAIKDLDDVLVNPDYDDLKAIIEAVKKQYKVV